MPAEGVRREHNIIWNDIISQVWSFSLVFGQGNHPKIVRQLRSANKLPEAPLWGRIQIYLSAVVQVLLRERSRLRHSQHADGNAPNHVPTCFDHVSKPKDNMIAELCSPATIQFF